MPYADLRVYNGAGASWSRPESSNLLDWFGSIQSVVLTPTGPRLTDRLDWVASAPSGVIVRTIAVGVCQSDIKEVAGVRPGPSQFGHEVVGEIIASWGDSGVQLGQRVCLDPNVALNRSSGFATHMAADGSPEALRQAFAPLPLNLSADVSVFAEPFACALHCIGRARAHLARESLGGLRIAVIGAGIAGLLLAWAARASHGNTVLLNRSADRLEFFDRHGMSPFVTLAPLEVSHERWDVIILATRFIEPECLAWALRHLSPSGLLLLYGGTSSTDGLTAGGQPLDPVRRGEQCIKVISEGKPILLGGSYGTDADSLRQAVRCLADDSTRWPVERLIERRLQLEELPTYLEGMTRGRILGKAIVECAEQGDTGGV